MNLPTVVCAIVRVSRRYRLNRDWFMKHFFLELDTNKVQFNHEKENVCRLRSKCRQPASENKAIHQLWHRFRTLFFKKKKKKMVFKFYSLVRYDLEYLDVMTCVSVISRKEPITNVTNFSKLLIGEIYSKLFSASYISSF